MFQTPLISLSLCFNLQDVSNNQLTAIPTSFALLVNLVRLNLACNQLKELPADLSAMKSKSFPRFIKCQTASAVLMFSNTVQGFKIYP